MQTKELKVHNLPYDRKINEVIDAKPYYLFIGIAVIGFIITFLKKGTIIGSSILIICLLALLFLPKRVLMEFSDDYLVMFNRASHDECLMVYYEDIVSWKYIRGIADDELEINLKDGSKATIEAFSRLVFENAMNHYVEEKRIKKAKKNK